MTASQGISADAVRFLFPSRSLTTGLLRGPLAAPPGSRLAMTSFGTTDLAAARDTPPLEAGAAISAWAWAALAVAVAGLAGSLFLSLGMNLKACPLCFY